MKCSQAQWEKLLQRWTDMEPTGEVRLICAVLASAIAEEPAEALRENREPYESRFFRDGFVSYSRAIGSDPVFLMERIRQAGDYWADQCALTGDATSATA